LVATASPTKVINLFPPGARAAAARERQWQVQVMGEEVAAV